MDKMNEEYDPMMEDEDSNQDGQFHFDLTNIVCTLFYQNYLYKFKLYAKK